MKILQVNHGFPKEQEAGSEIYCYNLAAELKKDNDVVVFCRSEKYKDGLNFEEYNGLPVYRVPEADRYNFDQYGQEPRIDEAFCRILDEFQPEIVHFHHLNHLSLNLVAEVKKHGIPVVFTLHDYWLICHRGQLIKKTPELEFGIITRCDQASVENCKSCGSTKFKKSNGDAISAEEFEEMIAERNQTIEQIKDMVDLFIAPSEFLRNVFIEYGFPENKIIYADYGFHTEYFNGYQHQNGEKFRFAYIGTCIPAKGIHILLDAMQYIPDEDLELKIYAQPNDYFKSHNEKLQNQINQDPRIESFGRYDNEKIAEILSQVDAIITPSEWPENSPLVIHEAFEAQILVITANVGGMKELVKDGEWGLLFEQGNAQDLAEKMKMLKNSPELYQKLQEHLPAVKTIEEDAAFIFKQYCALLKKYNKQKISQAIQEQQIITDAKPARLTCINSMACNLSCRMCQVHRRPEIAKKEHAFTNLLPWESFKRLADEIFPYLTEFLPTTMGEPMLTPYFDEFPNLCRKYGVKLNLTTNGTLLTAERAQAMIDVLKDVKISFDGATKEIYEEIRRGARYDQVIANIKMMAETRDQYCSQNPNVDRPTLTFQVTLQRDNIEQLPDLISLAKELGINRVKGYHLYVFEEDQHDQSLMFHRELSNQKITEAIALGSELGIITEFPAPFLLEDMIPQEPNRVVCKRLWEEVWVDHNGDIAPCCVPNRPVMGSLKEQTFMEIWNGEKYQEFRQGMQSGQYYPFCQNCSLLNEFEPGVPVEYDEKSFLCYDQSDLE